MHNFIIRNRSALYSICSLFLKLMSGPLAVLLVATKLTPEVQGVYYTFISISTIQWIFEIGFSTAIVQHLSATKVKSHFNSYVRVAVCFFTVMSLLVFLSSQLYAQWVFADTSKSIWLMPWLLYSLLFCLNILNNIVPLVEEGRINAEKVYLSKLISGVAYSVSLIISLWLGAGLYSLFISQLSMFLANVVLFKSDYSTIYFEYKSSSVKRSIAVAKSMLSFQYKLSLVWIVGYFYWNIYSVYFYKYVDAVFAGQYGATNSIINALAIAMTAWIQTKRSHLGNLVAGNKVSDTVPILKQALYFGLFGYIIIASIFILFLKLDVLNLQHRFLVTGLVLQIAIMRLAILAHEIVFMYFRTFRDEPFYCLSILNYIITPLVVIFSHRYGTIEYCFVAAIAIQYFLIIPIYIKSKKIIMERI